MLYFHKRIDTSLLLLVLHGLLLQTLLQPAAIQAHAYKNHLCDGENFRSILNNVELPSCLAANNEDAKSPARNCSMMHHFENLAMKQGKSLDLFMSRVTVMIFAHSEFIDEMIVPNNPTLELAAEMERHNAFIGVTMCLKAANSPCQRLRIACAGGHVGHIVFLISGYCTKSFGCSLIDSKDRDRPTTLLNLLQWVQFRLIERQVYIAKELGELQLTTSVGTEYLIQPELDDSYGKQLASDNSRPVVVFAAGPVKNLAYYQQLAWFLEAALTLRTRFVFHLIATPLSYVEEEVERPFYRWKIREHQSFLSLYTKQHCSSNSKWVYGCKPLMKIANEMLVPEQYSAFMLHGVLAATSMPGTPYPTFKAASEELYTFVHATASYVLSVMPVDELLTDQKVGQELFKSLVAFLGSSFSLTYYPVVVNKATALEVLEDLNTGLNLREAFERPSYFICMPNGAFIVLKNDEPIVTLDNTVRQISKEGSYQIMLESAREIFYSDMTELPEKITRSGHIVGATGRADEDTKDLVDEIRLSNRTDAFVEQMNFRDIYNVTGVLVVETDAKLMSNFFNTVGKDKPWMVLFTVSWSPLCKAARSIWASVGDCIKRMGFPDVQLVKVDCFEANEICQKLGIATYPTVAMFIRGIEMNTYSGPIVSDDLCLYAKLAFEPPVISSSSKEETRSILAKIFSLKSRAFVFRGAELPSQLSEYAKTHRFREVLIHEKSVEGAPQLAAIHRDAKPTASPYTGSLDDGTGLANYIDNSHLDSVFPCTWVYLPSALRLQRPLAILFHTDNEDGSAQLLQHLRSQFAGRVSICHINLRRFGHLNDLVNRLSGLNLPAMVALSKPSDGSGKVIHRLPLGNLEWSEISSRLTDWLEKAVNNQLTGGKKVEPQEAWKPATKVFNFVDEVYHGKTNSEPGKHRTHGSRAFTAEGEARVENLVGSQTMAEQSMPDVRSVKDEL